ncbi:trypsin-like serine protease [Actinoplanes sp. NPDC049316]|uniref:trypsin-like serine protease n=1 Tax=Actinoplanes sp. NPDC049316 TaxID=3154727 RepID=UPI00341E19EC
MTASSVVAVALVRSRFHFGAVVRTLAACVLLALVVQMACSGVPAHAATVRSGPSDAPGEYPFVVKVHVGDPAAGGRTCTGALVDAWWVVTAKRCLAEDGAPMRIGAPARLTRVTVGRAEVSGTGSGVVASVVHVVPHPDRDVVFAQLATAVNGVTPVKFAKTAPRADEVLRVAGYGRNAQEWVPDTMHTGLFAVTEVSADRIEIVGKNADQVGPCKGDAGGPGLRESDDGVELVALTQTGGQGGCLGSGASSENSATQTRLDGLGDWVTTHLLSFGSSFEPDDTRLNWKNSIDNTGAGAGGMQNIGGVCCSLTGPELVTGPLPAAHSGGHVLLYSGKDTSATKSYAYTKAFSLTHVTVRPETTLSYWIYPQSSATSGSVSVSGSNSTCVAVDLIFSNGTYLRGSGAKDQRGNSIHPAGQCGKLTLDTWNEVVVPIGAVAAGQQILKVDVGYDQPAGTGGYRGYIDDLKLSDVSAGPKFSTSVEAGQTQLAWTNTVDTGGFPHGGMTNVGGVCCSLTGPELKKGPLPTAHSGDNVLLYSGKDTSATKSYAYTKAFAPSDTFVTPTTRLSYWIYPQSSATSGSVSVSGSNSSCVAVDLIFKDQSSGVEANLRGSGAKDQHGVAVHPASQCANLKLDTWNLVDVPLGTVANGKQVTQITVGYDQPTNTGGYRGYVDDITIIQ